jgi:phosphoglycolate phosphatase-like HAD superfamily hydrolase
MNNKINLTQYQTLIFDCDGVILNSNKIKTQAFYDVAKVYGHKPAQKLKDYHVQNGGISRYEKFQYLIKNILQKPIETQELNKLLSNFSKEVKKALLICEVAKNIKELRDKTRNTKWLIVSGADQAELRDVFEQRGLDGYFDGGIFGSPDNKNTILKREKNKENITGKSLFIGDSMYDYQVSIASDMDFIFLTAWTDFYKWEHYFKGKYVQSFKSLSELISL